MTASASKVLRTRRMPARIAEPVDAIIDVLRRGNRFLICSHARPDGDAIGSVLALGMLLEQMGKEAEMVSADPVPQVYRMLPCVKKVRVAQKVSGAYDAVILLECDGLERAGVRGLERSFLINIDHHYSGRGYAQLNWINQSAASVGEMVYRLGISAGLTMTPQIATCLYTTLLTDTGGFHYGAVDASTFEIARALVDAGADPVGIAQQISFSAPVSKMRLLGAALNNLHREGRVAWLWVTHKEVARTCAAEEDAEGIVNYALGIEGIEAAAFLRELPDGQVRVSLRSKGHLNVAEVAERMGGGGHKTAAGCTCDGPLAKAVKEIPTILKNALRRKTV